MLFNPPFPAFVFVLYPRQVPAPGLPPIAPDYFPPFFGMVFAPLAYGLIPAGATNATLIGGQGPFGMPACATQAAPFYYFYIFAVVVAHTRIITFKREEKLGLRIL